MKFVLVALAALSIPFGAAAAPSRPAPPARPAESAGPAASRTSSQSFGFNGGYDMPMGTWRNVSDIGLHAGTNWCYEVNHRIGLGVDLDIHTLGQMTSIAPASTGVKQLWLRTVAVEPSVYARLNLTGGKSKATPFVRAGVGMYEMSQRLNSELTMSSSFPMVLAQAKEPRLGFNVGGGVRLAASEETTIDLEALFHYIPFPTDTKLVTGMSAYGKSSAMNLFTFGVKFNFRLGKDK